MKLKGLMLGVAAAATATTAQAADLPVAPEPVDYVRVCDAYGARFYYIPGTETCLRVGGRVRTQFSINNVMDDGNWGNRDSDGYSTLARGFVYLDARTASDTVLTFMCVVTRNCCDTTANQINYTAAFGNGFYAALSLEDRLYRDQGTYTLVSSTTGIGGTALDASSPSIYGGTRVPDLIGAIGVTQGWGGAKAFGAIHHVYPNGVINGITGDAEDKFGWAVGAGVDINLPFANSGSNIFFQGFYADGAMSYIGSNFAHNNSGVTILDFGLDAGGGTDTTTGWSLSSGVYIQATPTVGLALDGSYMSVDGGGVAGGPLTQLDIDRWALDASVVWNPVSGLAIGADIGYADTDIDGGTDYEDLVFGMRMQRTF